MPKKHTECFYSSKNVTLGFPYKTCNIEYTPTKMIQEAEDKRLRPCISTLLFWATQMYDEIDDTLYWCHSCCM